MDHRNGDSGMHGMLPRLLPVRTGTVRPVVTSHLFDLSLRQQQRRAPCPTVLFCIRDWPPTWPDTLAVRRACVQSCTHGHGYDPITGPECCASIIRSRIPTLIRPTMHVCGVNIPTGRRSSDRFGRDTVIMRTRVDTGVSSWARVARVART